MYSKKETTVFLLMDNLEVTLERRSESTKMLMNKRLQTCSLLCKFNNWVERLHFGGFFVVFIMAFVRHILLLIAVITCYQYARAQNLQVMTKYGKFIYLLQLQTYRPY